MRMCKKLKRGIEFIAMNDEAHELEVDEIMHNVSVMALSEAFNKRTEDIAKEIVRIREEEGCFKKPWTYIK